MTRTSYCWCHNQHEPVPLNVYRICFECGHVWTRWGLLRAYWRESAQSTILPFDEKLSRWQRARYFVHRWTMRPGRIFFCQECIHDW